jgi:hypothetical protein
MFLPICAPDVIATGAKGFWCAILTFISALHNTLRLFVIDGDLETVLNFTGELSGSVRHISNGIAGFLYIACPALTATGIMSLFENFTARIRYWWGYSKDAYIFSDLNDQSIKLARSLKQNDKKRKRMIVFTDVFKTNEESSYELIKQAQELDAVLFKSDITVVNFRRHSKKTKLYFFIIGEDETENINQTICLSAKPSTLATSSEEYKFNGYDYERKGGDTRVFLFTTHSSSEQQLSSINPDHLKLRRVNAVQSLIYKLLDDEGHLIFKSAVEAESTVKSPFTGEQVKEKLISAVIVGMGHHGTELLKALPWFCQLHPYRLEVTAFDIDPSALERFTSQCPELMSQKHNGDFYTDGEAHYKIRINPPLDEEAGEKTTGYDVHSIKFDQAIESLDHVTYVLVALGNDDLNVQVAAKIRILLKRRGIVPFIHSIVYNPDKQELLKRGTNFSGLMYDINPTGNISINYSEECILNSDIEEKALERHLAWTKKFAAQENWPSDVYEKEIRAAENAFWKYDYNYRSSVASALHAKFKRPGLFPIGVDPEDETKVLYYEHAGVPGADKLPAERTEEELWYLRKMEHQRWNAYVRSEGFVFAEKRDKLAKTHNLLVPFDKLPLSEQEKDDD